MKLLPFLLIQSPDFPLAVKPLVIIYLKETGTQKFFGISGKGNFDYRQSLEFFIAT